MFMFRQQDQKRSNQVARKLHKGLLKSKYGLSAQHDFIEGKDNTRINITNWSIIDLTTWLPVGKLKESTHCYKDGRSSFQRTGEAFGIDLCPNDIGHVLGWDFSDQIDMYENKHGV